MYYFNEFLSEQDEFYRAMYCPEVEQQRKNLQYDNARLENKLKSLDKFVRLTQYSDEYGERFGIQIQLDRALLGQMAGNMDALMDRIRYIIGNNLAKLYY